MKIKPIVLRENEVSTLLAKRKCLIKRHLDPRKLNPHNSWVEHSEWVPNSAHAPYQHGQIYWVREKWWQGNKPLNPDAWDPPEPPEPMLLYAADRDYSDVEWQPAITMPRWAARLFIEIKDVHILHNLNDYKWYAHAHAQVIKQPPLSD